MSEENKAVIRRWVEELWNKGDLSTVEELFSQEWVNHTPAGDESGLDSIRQEVPRRRAAFPDLQMTIEDLVAEGDKVAVRVRMIGTQEGEYRGLRAKGNKVDIWAVTIRRIRNGKMVEGWTLHDSAVFMRQLGHSG